MRFVFALLLLAMSAGAQTDIGVAPSRCAGPSVQVAVSVPVSFGAATVSIPVCVALGPGLSIDTTTVPPRLVVAIPPAAPRIVVQRFVPPSDLPGDGAWTFQLRHEPVGAILASFRSSRIGGDAVDIVTPGGGASPKEVRVAMPRYPFNAGDILTILYWTTEQQ
jgi:hypothetical protein